MTALASSRVFRAPVDGGARAASSHIPARIMLAEDDTEMRRVIAEALRMDGHVVSTFDDGGRLLVAVAEICRHPDEQPDLIISDIRMPVCTGLSIVESLRQTESAIPIILMTAFGDAETRAHADHLGAILFDKPFALEDLRTVVMILLPRA